jgi:hypothetical protein
LRLKIVKYRNQRKKVERKRRIKNPPFFNV